VFETVWASSLTICAYQIGEHRHLKRCDLQVHHCFLNDRPIACSWYIKNRKKPRSKSVFDFLHYTQAVEDKDKFEIILEIIESVVSSPFVKAEADSVEYFVLCLKQYAF
jgi:hypothetical protein